MPGVPKRVYQKEKQILYARHILLNNISACGKRFAAEGAKVILCARNVVELNRVKKEISGDEVNINSNFQISEYD